MAQEERLAVGQKSERLTATRKQLEAFAGQGGDLRSKEAVPLGLELVHAFNDLAREFGHEILKRTSTD